MRGSEKEQVTRESRRLVSKLSVFRNIGALPVSSIGPLIFLIILIIFAEDEQGFLYKLIQKHDFMLTEIFKNGSANVIITFLLGSLMLC